MGMAQDDAIKAGLRIIMTPEKALITAMAQKQYPFSLRCMVESVIQVSPAYVFRDNDSIVLIFIKCGQKCSRPVLWVYYKHVKDKYQSY